MTPAVFDLTITVQPTDIDELNHVNNVVYVRWVQDAATAHWNNEATDVIKKAFYWVVLRHEIDYKSPALANDEIIARTWVDNYEGVRSVRMVRFIRKHDNKLLAEAKTTWCLLSTANNRPSRVPHDIRSIFNEGHLQ